MKDHCVEYTVEQWSILTNFGNKIILEKKKKMRPYAQIFKKGWSTNDFFKAPYYEIDVSLKIAL